MPLGPYEQRPVRLPSYFCPLQAPGVDPALSIQPQISFRGLDHAREPPCTSERTQTSPGYIPAVRSYNLYGPRQRCSSNHPGNTVGRPGRRR